jgi:hypothetical protein
MTILVPNTGEVIALSLLVNKTAPENLVYRLFATNVTPAETDTAGSYTEAAGGGYAAITTTGANWTVTGGAPSTAAYAQQTYTFTGPLTTNATIYGYYVTQATSGTLVLAETFTSFTPAANGDNIKLTPQITAD